MNAVEEDRHVWKLYLNRAVAAGDDALFESALSYSKTPAQKVEIMRARASASIQQGRLHLAAIYYAQSGLSFDEVALSLLHCLDFASGNTSSSNSNSSSSAEGAAPQFGNALLESNASYFNTPNESDVLQTQPSYTRVNYHSSSFVDAAISAGAALTPLKVFLLQVLRSLPSAAKMQRTMLCTWLSDLYLHQISLAKLLNPQSAATTPGGGSAANNNAGADFEPMVKSDDLLDEAELTTQFKNFLRSNK